jgi:Domain of unknown function (DUF3846)
MPWAVTIDTLGKLDVLEEKPDLRKMQDVVGGYIEAVRMSDTYYGSIMWLNEEGKLKGLEPNVIATMMVSDIIAPDYIVGNVLITGDEDKEGEIMQLTDEQMTVLMVMFIGAHDYIKKKYTENH